jgi:uncharacterized membrane protein
VPRRRRQESRLLPLTSLALVVLAAFIHAAWNLLSKRSASAGAVFVAVYTAASSVLYAPWVFWVLASGTSTWSWPAAACIFASGALHLAYSLCLQRGYQVADLSVVYPVARGSAPSLSSIAAFTLLGEHASTRGVAGLVAVVLGIFLISTSGDLSALRRREGSAGLRWGLATGGLIAAYSVVDAFAVSALSVHPVVLDWSANAVRVALFVPIWPRLAATATARMRGHWRTALAVAVLSPLSYIFVLAAIHLGARLSLVAPAREMSMMIGALFGMVILREPMGRWRLVGCAILTVGVVCLGYA